MEWAALVVVAILGGAVAIIGARVAEHTVRLRRQREIDAVWAAYGRAVANAQDGKCPMPPRPDKGPWASAMQDAP